jgi:hypothetical protein
LESKIKLLEMQNDQLTSQLANSQQQLKDDDQRSRDELKEELTRTRQQIDILKRIIIGHEVPEVSNMMGDVRSNYLQETLTALGLHIKGIKLNKLMG